MSSSVWLSGVGASLGRLCGIEELRTDGESQETIDILSKRGIETYSRIEGGLGELIVARVAETLVDAGVDAGEVDGVLFVTESFSELVERPTVHGDTEFWTARNGLFDMLSGLGIRNASVFCSTFGGSGNFLQALFLADPLVRSGRVSVMLIICIDRHPIGVSRFMHDAVAVTGDGVATCVVSSKASARLSFEIQYLGMRRIRQEHGAAMAERMLEVYRTAKGAAADCYDATGFQPRDFNWLLMSNYNHLMSQIFARLLGFPLEKAWLHNVPRTGHVPACDPLLGLAELERSAQLKANGAVMLFITGPLSCGTVAVRYRSAQPMQTAPKGFAGPSKLGA